MFPFYNLFKGILSTTIVIFLKLKIIVVFRIDLHKMKINTELCCKRYDFFDKKDPKLSLSEFLSRITRIKIYSYDLLCEPVLSMRRLFRNYTTCGSWAKEKVSTRGRKWTLTDSERKMNRSEVSSKWNKCRIYVGDQLDRWNELKEVLRVQTRAEMANILLDR